MTTDFITSRSSLVRSLSTLAQIIGVNTSSAILFNDSTSANNTLALAEASTQPALRKHLRPERYVFRAAATASSTGSIPPPIKRNRLSTATDLIPAPWSSSTP